ncbi:MAG: TauD/TfdA family dioxygenase [Burkholderiaceae bacterium]
MTEPMAVVPTMIRHPDPFSLDDDRAWRDWRARKLADLPASTDALLVEINDPFALSRGEQGALLDRCTRWNMALYRLRRPGDALARDAGGGRFVRALGAQIGLHRLDRNWLAGDEGVSLLRVNPQGGVRGDYIPYTDRPIGWHTDGYYYPPERRIDAMLLHCLCPAARGGGNRLLDPELAYLRLRELDPAHIAALSADDAMTIPAREADTRDDGDPQQAQRPAQSGPVFWRDPLDGRLRMRYTARTRSIVWNPDPATQAARAALQTVLAREEDTITLRLGPGMGLICNNVLHTREAFVDDAQQTRRVLRARYRERITG